MEIKRFLEREEAFDFLVERFFQLADQAISAKGTFNVSVSGGSTPAPFFRELVNKASEFNAWDKVNFFWVDERWVPFEDKESNVGEASRLGLTAIPAHFYPFPTGSQTPEMAIDTYQQQMKSKLIDHHGFDLILLGAGADEHTASIFHSNLSAACSSELAFATMHPITKQIRLSISMPVISQSENVILILLGEEKRPILKSLTIPKATRMSPVQIAIFTTKNPVIVTDIND